LDIHHFISPGVECFDTFSKIQEIGKAMLVLPEHQAQEVAAGNFRVFHDIYGLGGKELALRSVTVNVSF
jgi:hypothetical protein